MTSLKKEQLSDGSEKLLTKTNHYYLITKGNEMTKTNTKIKDAVENVLKSDKGSRNNDVRLIRLTLQKLKFPQDMETLEKLQGNIFETIRRYRQKIQEQNPFLQATEKTRCNRQKRKEQIEEWLREEL